jgi:hypothetical protein
MVFLPIAVTWASLWLEFDRYRSEPGNSNFLQLWLNGWGRFAVPAVVVLVSLVILLTALLHVQESRNTEAGDNSVLRREIGELLMQVTYQLTVSASAQARIIPTAKLERAARDISTSTHALTQALTSTTDQLAAIFRPGPEGQFTKALGEWTDSARELGAMGRALTVPQEILNRFVQLRSLLAQEERELAAAIQVMVVELKQTSEVSRATAHAHQAVATEVMEDTRSMGAAMERFVEHSEGLNFYMDALNRVLQSLEDAVGPSVSGPVYPDPAEPGYTGMSNADLPLPDEPDQHRNGVPPQHTSGPRHSPPSSWYSTDQDQNGEEDQDR